MEPLPDAAELFDRHGAAVRRRCRQLLGSQDLANDALQEIFVKVLSRRHTFRGQCSALTWLYGIATLHCPQQLRNHRRRDRDLLPQLAYQQPQLAPPPDADSGWRDLLGDSPPRTQEIAWLRHVEGLTLEEVAEATGLSRKTVSKCLEQFARDARERSHPLSAPERP